MQRLESIERVPSKDQNGNLAKQQASLLLLEPDLRRRTGHSGKALESATKAKYLLLPLEMRFRLRWNHSRSG